MHSIHPQLQAAQSDLAVWATYVRLCLPICIVAIRCPGTDDVATASPSPSRPRVHYYSIIIIATYTYVPTTHCTSSTTPYAWHACLHACDPMRESCKSLAALSQTHACRRGVSKVKPLAHSFKQKLSGTPCSCMHACVPVWIFHCPNRATGRRQGVQRRGAPPRRTGDHCPRHTDLREGGPGRSCPSQRGRVPCRRWPGSSPP